MYAGRDLCTSYIILEYKYVINDSLITKIDYEFPNIKVDWRGLKNARMSKMWFRFSKTKW